MPADDRPSWVLCLQVLSVRSHENVSLLYLQGSIRPGSIGLDEGVSARVAESHASSAGASPKDSEYDNQALRLEVSDRVRCGLPVHPQLWTLSTSLPVPAVCAALLCM